MPTPSPNHPTAQRLDLDWRRLVRSTEHCDLDELLVASGWRPSPAPGDVTRGNGDSDATAHADADRALAALVTAARSDPLAARVVLQRLVPGLIAVARRRAAWMGHPPGAVLDDLLAEAWIVIRHFPVERRPVHLAGNLLREIEYHTFTRPARLRRHGALAGDGVALRCTAAPAGSPIDGTVETAQVQRHERFGSGSAFDDVVDVLQAVAESGAHDDDLRFLGALASGLTTDELAARRSVSGRAERYRRARLIEWIQTEVLDLPTRPDDRTRRT